MFFLPDRAGIAGASLLYLQLPGGSERGDAAMAGRGRLPLVRQEKHNGNDGNTDGLSQYNNKRVQGDNLDISQPRDIPKASTEDNHLQETGSRGEISSASRSMRQNPGHIA